jgi:dienelactone hydrolase
MPGVVYPCCPTDRKVIPREIGALNGVTVKYRVPNSVSVETYLTGNSSSWIVMIYDIFGMHANTYELADWIATNKNMSVAIPDVRDGRNWPINLYPPPADKKEEFYKWLENDGNFERAANYIRACIDFLIEEKGARSISLLGICWGAKVATLIDSYNGKVKAVVGPHPSFLKIGDGENVTVPTLLMPAQEDNLTIYLAGVLRNPEPKKVLVSEHYVTTFHGFLGGRGQWEKPEEKPYYDKAREELCNFISSQSHSKSSSDHCTSVPPVHRTA